MSLPTAWLPLQSADIYVLDHVLRGTIRAGDRVLDIGCGSGRQFPVLTHAGAVVTAVDHDPEAVQACRQLAATLPGMVDVMPGRLPDLALNQTFDAVICNAVLHFASDQASFHTWADACWRHVAPGGFFFARLSTRIGLSQASVRGFAYLADEDDIRACEQRWQATRVDPLKTTLVETLRTMTTWTLRKTSA